MKLPRLSILTVLGFALVLGTAGRGMAQEKSSKRPKPKRNPVFAPIKNDPALPRVLLIGDSISIGYTLPVRAALAKRANVHRPAANCGPTTRGLTQIDKWLGKGKWDVIHFNWGLHDLKFIEGKRQVPLAEYENNMQRLVARLKKTRAKLVWCSTTPVPKGCSPPRTNEDVIAYNAVGRKIMDRHGVGVDDLYAFALPRLKKIQRPANVHFTPQGSKILAGQVATSILEALKKPASK